MPNTVSAAATGLPKVSRRNVVSALAASTAMAAPVIAGAADNPDAPLLALFEEWKRAKAASEAVFVQADEADEALHVYERTIPEVAKFKSRVIGRNPETADQKWTELEILTEGGPNGTRRFQADAYEIMRRAAGHNEWFKDPDMWTADKDGWIAPYAPPLKASVAEILAAYDPWNAERQRLKEAWAYDAKAAAAVHAIDRIDSIERCIAGTRAKTEAGWRAKATIVLHVWRSVASAREAFLAKVSDNSSDRPDSVDLIEQSIAFDLLPMEA